MQFIKKYWFSLLMSVFLLCVVAYFIVVFISPRYDLQHRGFIPCTEKLAENVEICGRDNILCVLKAIGQDNLCNLGVVISGFRKWIDGEQKTPWSNYIFEPDLPQDNSDNNEELQEFYQENPNIIQDMQMLKKMNKEQDLNE